MLDTDSKSPTTRLKVGLSLQQGTWSTELLKVVAFVFSVPVSSAYAEEDIWCDKSNSPSVAMAKAELQLSLNFKILRPEFKMFLQEQRLLIAAGKGNTKYKLQ